MEHCFDVQDKEQMFETIILFSVFSLSGFLLYSDWVCTAVMSNDLMKDLRG